MEAFLRDRTLLRSSGRCPFSFTIVYQPARQRPTRLVALVIRDCCGFDWDQCTRDSFLDEINVVSWAN